MKRSDLLDVEIDLGDARTETRGSMPVGKDDPETGLHFIAGALDTDD